jgi:putative transposase
MGASRAIARFARAMAGYDWAGGEAAAFLGAGLAALTSGEIVVCKKVDGVARYRYRLPDGVSPPDVTPRGPSIHAALVQAKDDIEELGWLGTVSSYVVREAVGDVDNGWKLFFEHLKQGRYERAGVPRFRSSRERRYHADQPGGYRVRADAVKLPGIGWVRLKEKGYIPITQEKSHHFLCGGKICGGGITERDGRWFVALRCEVPRPSAQKRAPGRALRDRPVPRVKGLVVGADSGVRETVVTSEGQRFEGFRSDERLKALERRLKLWERRKERRYRKGKPRSEQSAGWKEAVRWVGHYHLKVAQLQDDRLGKIVRAVVDTGAERIVVRGPQVHGMLSRNVAPNAGKRSALAPELHRARMGDFSRRVQYKVAWAGGECIEASVDFESTKICSACGTKRETDPGYSGWTCKACGAEHEREQNSARNLKLYQVPPEAPQKPGKKAPKQQPEADDAEPAAEAAE